MSWERREVYVEDKKSLSTFSARVYGWMAMGLGVTAFVTFFLMHTGLYRVMAPLSLFWVIGTLGIAFGFNAAVKNAGIGLVAGLFLAYSVLQGMLFGTILPAYASAFGGGIIWVAFASAAVIFLLAMAYGLTTNSDLTKMGRILSFGVIGLIAMSLLMLVLSFFMQVTFLHLMISYVGLAIFVGLTAFDAQKIRAMSTQVDANSVIGYKLSIVMALSMYINVIMIFWYLLQIFSSNRK